MLNIRTPLPHVLYNRQSHHRLHMTTLRRVPYPLGRDNGLS